MMLHVASESCPYQPREYGHWQLMRRRLPLDLLAAYYDTTLSLTAVGEVFITPVLDRLPCFRAAEET